MLLLIIRVVTFGSSAQARASNVVFFVWLPLAKPKPEHFHPRHALISLLFSYGPPSAVVPPFGQGLVPPYTFRPSPCRGSSQSIWRYSDNHLTAMHAYRHDIFRMGNLLTSLVPSLKYPI